MNVLLIMTDQQRFDTLGCYGNKVIETANLDGLASEGTIFSSCYSPSPSCVPARASLLTGMNPWNTGILGMGRGQGPMGVGFDYTLPGEMAKAGYHTQGIGKMHFYPQRSLNGFHHTMIDESGREQDPNFISDYKQWFNRNKSGDHDIVDHGISWNSWMARPYHAPEFLHPTNWTVNESIRFLKHRDPSKPFFLKTSFARPHSPYDAPDFYFNLYLNKELPEPMVGEWASCHDVPQDAVKPDAWRGKRRGEEIRRAKAGYYGLIHHIDHQIGRLLTYLKDIDEYKDTMIVFTSDHGDMMGDHHLWRKTYAYEGSAKVPLIVKFPRSMAMPAGQIIQEPVTLQDIMPTILEAVEAEIPETVDGLSLVSLIMGGNRGWREYVHGEHSTIYSEEQEMQYVTDGKYKYIWLPRIGEEQLFNLEEDPNEMNNLALDEQCSEKLQQWRSRLVSVLEPRNLGLTEGNRLICQKGKPPIVSPNYSERLSKFPLPF